jgi:hypothetical protein
MVLHNTKNEDGIKYFFQEVHELYIKVFTTNAFSPSLVLLTAHAYAPPHTHSRRSPSSWVALSRCC